MGGDENNEWLRDTPSEGDRPPGMPAGLDGGIDVRPDSLTRFANQTLSEARAFARNMHDGVDPLQAHSSNIGKAFTEAVDFEVAHTQGIQKLRMFTAEAELGTSLLGEGARSIGSTYLNGDAMSAATLKDVETAFNPAKGQSVFDQPEAGAPTKPAPTGEAGNGNIPEADPEAVAKIQAEATEAAESGGFDPTGRSEDITVDLGKNATYTIPGKGTGDIESINVQPELKR